MKKFFSLFIFAFLALLLIGCQKKEQPKARTFKADGTYLAYQMFGEEKEIKPSEETATLPEGANPSEWKGGKLFQPSLQTVEVEIQNDKVVDVRIDELQSHKNLVWDKANKELKTSGFGASSFNWNELTKQQLYFNYGMNFMKEDGKPNKLGEWFIHAKAIEKHLLAQAQKGETFTALAQSTMHQEGFVKLVQEALQNAKDGVVKAVQPGEHYKNDLATIEAKVNEAGKLSNFKVNALFIGKDGDKLAVLDKYAKYTVMSHDPSDPSPKKWQDQIDLINKWLNAGKYHETLTPAKVKNYKGLIVNGEAVEALAGVTIQTHGTVAVIHKLFKYFKQA